MSCKEKYLPNATKHLLSRFVACCPIKENKMILNV